MRTSITATRRRSTRPRRDGGWAHVLATPGMDRHVAYVSLSRHRDGVDLHYGREDFADRDQLARTLVARARQGHGLRLRGAVRGARGWCDSASKFDPGRCRLI